MTFNANGIRSAADKGFWKWFHGQNADILCVQELKAQEQDLQATVRDQQGYRSWAALRAEKRVFGCGCLVKN